MPDDVKDVQTDVVDPNVADPNAKPAEAAAEPAKAAVDPDPAQVQAEAATAAQAAAEAAKPKAEDKPAVEPEAPTGDWPVLGHKAGDDAMQVMKAAGLSVADLDAIFGEANTTQDMSKVDLAKLNEKLGPHAANLVMLGINTFHADVTARNAETVAAVHEVAGGEESWKALTTWAQGKETAGDKAFNAKLGDLREAIDSGGWLAKAAAAELKSMYEADPNNGSLVTTLEVPTRTGGTELVEVAKLSRAQYHDKLDALHRAGKTAEFKQLQAARARSRN